MSKKGIATAVDAVTKKDWYQVRFRCTSKRRRLTGAPSLLPSYRARDTANDAVHFEIRLLFVL